MAVERSLVDLGTTLAELDLVYVHRGDTDNGREFAGRDAWGTFERVLAARAADPAEADAATPPAPLERERLVGRYAITPGVEAEVYEHEGRLLSRGS